MIAFLRADKLRELTEAKHEAENRAYRFGERIQSLEGQLEYRAKQVDDLRVQLIQEKALADSFVRDLTEARRQAATAEASVQSSAQRALDAHQRAEAAEARYLELVKTTITAAPPTITTLPPDYEGRARQAMSEETVERATEDLIRMGLSREDATNHAKFLFARVDGAFDEGGLMTSLRESDGAPEYVPDPA